MKKKAASKKEAPSKRVGPVKIKVIGVGGSGKNATNHMIKSGITGIEFIAANTDEQDLKQSKAMKKIHLGENTTKGLGTGMNPALGKKAAEESITEIQDALKGSELVFIACGMGGGTGTGAAPIIARAALDMGILTVAIATKPFSFEGSKRKDLANDGFEELARCTDAMVIIPNDNILASASEKTTMAEAFSLSDEVLQQAVAGISHLIIKPGDINIDFADIKTILDKSGLSLLGLGFARGSNRAEMSVSRAISSPLLETSIDGARKVLFSISSRSRSDITMKEVQTIAEKISESVDKDAKIIFGTSTDKDLKQGEVRITLIATDFDGSQSRTNKRKVPKVGQKFEKLSDFKPDDDDEILYDGDDKEKDDGEENPLWKKLWGKE